LGPDKGFRGKVFKALHAEALKRGIDHDGLRDMFGVKSMSTIETHKLVDKLKSWTGKGIRRSSPLPRRGYATKRGPAELVSAEDLNTLAEAFSRRGMDSNAQWLFIQRQLQGRDTIRTRADFHRVFSGIRAMNRRDGI
jgi:hypothetical protein